MFAARLRCMVLGVSLTLAGYCAPSMAQDQQAFVVESVNSQLNQSVYFLNAVFRIRLPHYIVSALEQGVDLPLVMEIEVYRHRSLWFDKRIVVIRQQYRIAYDALLDEFSVFNVNAGMKLFYPTLDKAVASLTVLIDYPGLDNNALVPGELYNMRLRFGIDTIEIPLPLKSTSLLENDWSLTSDWFEWELNP